MALPPPLVPRIFGSWLEYAGVMRSPAAGSDESGADDRMVMYVLPFFAGSMKLPVNVAPACSRIVSPGFAALSAACKSPPALTVKVAAFAIWLARRTAHNDKPIVPNRVNRSPQAPGIAGVTGASASGTPRLLFDDSRLICES